MNCEKQIREKQFERSDHSAKKFYAKCKNSERKIGRKVSNAKSIIAKCKIAKYLLKGNGKVFQQFSEKGCEGEGEGMRVRTQPSHPHTHTFTPIRNGKRERR